MQTTTTRRTTWLELLRTSALAGVLASMLIMALVERALVPPALLIGVLFVVGLVVSLKKERRGVHVLTVVSGLAALMYGVLAVPDLLVPASFWSFVVTWLAAISAVAGLVAGVILWRGGHDGIGATRARAVALGLVAVMVVVGFIANLSYGDAKPHAGDVTVVASGSSFAQRTLNVSHGEVSFFLDNRDQTLHDFHIIGANVSAKTIPAGHKARVTYTLSPGTYEYHCDFHDSMKGTLRVS